jgi:hypothetical protein
MHNVLIFETNNLAWLVRDSPSNKFRSGVIDAELMLSHFVENADKLGKTIVILSIMIALINTKKQILISAAYFE